MEGIGSDAIMLTVETLRRRILPRPADGHKGTFGHSLIIAGQHGMAGASVLASRACLRSGVGKVSVHVPLQNLPILQVSVPEAIVDADADDRVFANPVEDLSPYSSVAIGPGIGVSAATSDALRRQFLILSGRSCILDADALNCIAAFPELMRLVPRNSILTPHPAEYARLAGIEPPCEFAVSHCVVLVLKGHPTRIFLPDGEAYECSWGNNGMGTAGSGDVLTGLMAGLMAQGHSVVDTALLGVGIHALAGDCAAKCLGVHSLIASDIIHHFPAAFAMLCDACCRQ